jgi:hypothetical protein
MPDENKSFLRELLDIVKAVTPMQWVASLIGLLTIGGMVWVIYTGANFFDDSTKARGLITFSVAIVTVAIALLLVFYLVIGGGAIDEVKERFTYGKDILLVFVGILGTIMGFYYGADTVSSDKYAALAETVQTDAAQKSPIGDLEKKGFVALLAKDLDGASQAFADAYKLSPTYHNVDEINKLLNVHKGAFAKAKGENNTAEIDKLWKVIFCDISDNKRTLGMLPEMIAQVKKNCPASNTPTPSPSTAPSPISSPT